MNVQHHRAELIDAGYQHGHGRRLRSLGPSHTTLTGPTIDQEVAAAATCAHCGHVGLWCEHWHNTAEHSLIALAVCPRCQHADEF